MPAAGYHPDRFARAVRLVLSGCVERLGNGHYRVAGNVEESYDVDVNGDPACYCRDMENRAGQIKGNCKHVLAARLAGLDPALVKVLAERIEREERDANERKPTRRKATTEGA